MSNLSWWTTRETNTSIILNETFSREHIFPCLIATTTLYFEFAWINPNLSPGPSSGPSWISTEELNATGFSLKGGKGSCRPPADEAAMTCKILPGSKWWFPSGSLNPLVIIKVMTTIRMEATRTRVGAIRTPGAVALSWNQPNVSGR